MMSRIMKLFILLAVSSSASGQEDSTVRYLANEGVMVAHGDTKILFDPLFEYLLLKHFALTVLLDLLGKFQMFRR